MLLNSQQRSSFPDYDPNYIRDGMLLLAKYYNRNISLSDPAIEFFHNYQKLVKDSQSEAGLDPYPVKHIGNLDVLFKALSSLFTKLVEAIIKSNSNRR